MPRAEYRGADGSLYPGVTTVLDVLGLKTPALMAWAAKEAREGRDYQATRRSAADAGTYAHALVCRHIEEHVADDDTIRGMLDDADEVAAHLSDDERAQGLAAFEAWLKWWREQRPARILALEANLSSDLYRCGGTPDLVFLDADGRVRLCDWKGTKAGRVYVEHPIQLAAYGMLLSSTHGRHVDSYHLVLMPRDGRAVRTRDWRASELEAHRAAFLAALQIHHLKAPLEASTRKHRGDDA